MIDSMGAAQVEDVMSLCTQVNIARRK